MLFLFGRSDRIEKCLRKSVWGCGRNNKMDVNEITYKINGAVFEVNRVLGLGFLEKVYENALLIELRRRGLRVESQVPIQIQYKGQLVGDYLKATGFKVGMLVNFKHPKADIKRFVMNLPEGQGTNCSDKSSPQ